MSNPGFRLGRTILIPAALFILAQSGCAFLESSGSFSDSSGSLSDSSGSLSNSFDSSSDSSSGDDDHAYREDIRDFTTVLARAQGSPTSLRRGVAEIALGRGISDWEAAAGTFAAIGEGLARADVDERQLAAYQRAIATPGSSAFTAVATGYASTLP